MDTRVTSKGEADGAAAKRRSRWLVAITISLALLAGGTTYLRCTMLDPVIFSMWGHGTDNDTGPLMADAWFTSDIPLVAELASDRWSNMHYRTSRHPLTSLVLYPPVKGLQVLGVSQAHALWTVTVAVSAVWTALLFFLLTTWGCRLFDAVIFTLLANVSASAVFWFAVPEVFAYGSVTILAALLLTIWPERVPVVVRHTLALAVSLSMTVTNAVVGLIGAVRSLSMKDLWIAGTSAFFLVTLLWAAAKAALFPLSDYFLPPSGDFTATNSVAPTPGRIFMVVQSLVAATMVMPRIEVIKGDTQWVTTVQNSIAWGGDFAGAIATVAWIALLGLAAATARKAPAGMWRLCALSAAAMIVFHIVFGKETFLYSLHILPLLVVLAAAVTFTRWRRVGLALAGTVVVLGGIHNWNAFQDAADIIRDEAEWALTFPGAQPPP